MPSSDNGTQDWLSFVIRCEEKTPALRQECCEAKSSVPGASPVLHAYSNSSRDNPDCLMID